MLTRRDLVTSVVSGLSALPFSYFFKEKKKTEFKWRSDKYNRHPRIEGRFKDNYYEIYCPDINLCTSTYAYGMSIQELGIHSESSYHVFTTALHNFKKRLNELHPNARIEWNIPWSFPLLNQLHTDDKWYHLGYFKIGETT